MKANVSYYKITLTPLTPLHIGSGEVLDPYEYLITSKDGYDFLYKIDLMQLIERASQIERDNLLKVLDAPDLYAQRRTIADLAGKYFSSRPELFCQFSTVGSDVKSTYDDLLKNPSSQSRLEIHVMTRDQNGLAYVPGSSLKGAIRTAWLNHLAEQTDETKLQRQLSDVTGQKIPLRYAPQAKHAQAMEAHLLGNAKINTRINDRGATVNAVVQKDPFRAIQLTDLNQNDDGPLFSHIVRLNILSKNANRPQQRGTRQNTERIQLYCDCLVPCEGENLALTGRLSLQNHLWSAECFGQKVITGVPITAEKLLQALNNFYRARFNYEYENYYTKQKEWNLAVTADWLKDDIEKIDPACEALILVGRFSQFESLTISRFHRDIRSTKVRFGDSRTVAKEDTTVPANAPLGWCKLRMEPMAR